MQSVIDPIGLIFSVFVAMWGVYQVIYGIRLLQDKYSPFMVDFFYFLYIRVMKGEKAVKRGIEKFTSHKIGS